MVGALVLLILVVACANLGGLMMARGISREHEIGIRIAIGANRKRIFRQLFTESLLLALLGSVAGLALSCIVMRITLAATDAPRWMSAIPDWRVLLFTGALAVLVAVLFGLAPAWQVARQRQRRTLARQILIAAQLAASSVLLIVAALLVRAAHHVLYTDPGFDTSRSSASHRDWIATGIRRQRPEPISMTSRAVYAAFPEQNRSHSPNCRCWAMAQPHI